MANRLASQPEFSSWEHCKNAQPRNQARSSRLALRDIWYAFSTVPLEKAG